MQTLQQDLAFAFRQLCRHPVYAVTAIISMALGIGATAAVYSVLYGVLVDPFPYRDAAHIASIVTQTQGDDKNNSEFTLAEVDLLRHTHAITDIIAERRVTRLLTGGDVPESVHVEESTGNLFTFLGTPPLLGRSFTLADAPLNVEPQPVAVLSYLFWKSHFGGSANAVGSQVELNHQRYAIIGVMGPRFTWTDADVYLPLPVITDPQTSFQTLFRVRADLSKAAIAGELESLTRQIASRYPDSSLRGPFRVWVESLNDNLLGEFKGTLLSLFVAVALLLLIGCGNVSILLLARGAARQYELAMRAALGATPARIARQLLTEAVFLSVAGGALGTGIAFGALHLIFSLIPEYSIPHEVVISLNLPVLLFSTAISVATGILAGLSPALQLSKAKVAETVQAASSRTVTVAKTHTQGALITVQIALTVLLLAASAAAMRQFLEAYRARLGFDPHHVLVFYAAFPDRFHNSGEDSRQAQVNYEDAMLEKIENVPGVEGAASLVTGTPPDYNWIQQVDVVGEPQRGSTRAVTAIVGPEYFSVLHIPILEGRTITRAEVLRGAHLAVVSKLFADRYLPPGSALGRLIKPKELARVLATSKTPGAGTPYQVVGVAGDVRNDGLHRPIQPAVYVPSSALTRPWAGFAVRTAGDPHQLLRPISRALGTLDSSQSISRSYVFDEYLGDVVWARERFISSLFSLFAFIALSLAAIGLVSVVAFRVEQRTREIGIRAALGAGRAHILRVVLQPTVITAGTGLVLGVGLSVGLSRYAYKWTQSSMSSAPVLLIVSGLLLVVAAVSALMTARRAMKIQPVIALKNE